MYLQCVALQAVCFPLPLFLVAASKTDINAVRL